MHELSIALSIIDLATQEAQRQASQCVLAVHLRVGALCGVVPEALRSAYELAREDSPLSRAELFIEQVPVRLKCAQCGGERGAVSPWELVCADCGTPSGDLVSGRELELCALEIA